MFKQQKRCFHSNEILTYSKCSNVYRTYNFFFRNLLTIDSLYKKKKLSSRFFSRSACQILTCNRSYESSSVLNDKSYPSVLWRKERPGFRPMEKPQSGRFKIPVRFSEATNRRTDGLPVNGMQIRAPYGLSSIRWGGGVAGEGAIFPLIIKIPNPIATRACGCLIFNGESKTNYDNSI